MKLSGVQNCRLERHHSADSVLVNRALFLSGNRKAVFCEPSAHGFGTFGLVCFCIKMDASFCKTLKYWTGFLSNLSHLNVLYFVMLVGSKYSHIFGSLSNLHQKYYLRYEFLSNEKKGDTSWFKSAILIAIYTTYIIKKTGKVYICCNSENIKVINICIDPRKQHT